jgi:hypothetical protein
MLKGRRHQDGRHHPLGRERSRKLFNAKVSRPLHIWPFHAKRMRAPGAAAQQAEVALPRKLSTRKGKQGSEVQPKRRPVLENANGNETLETKLPLSRVVFGLVKTAL